MDSARNVAERHDGPPLAHKWGDHHDSLGFTVLFGWAAWKLEPTLVRAACAGWLLAATLHLIFHATHLDNFDTADAIAELASLAFLLIPPAVAIWAVGDQETL